MNEKKGVEDMGWEAWTANGATQNASEMAEATQIAKQVQRCEKGETNGVARLARWCDGGAGAGVVPKNKGFCDKNRHKVPAKREQEWHHAKRVDRERKGRECGGLIVGVCKDGGQSHQAMQEKRDQEKREDAKG